MPRVNVHITNKRRWQAAMREAPDIVAKRAQKALWSGIWILDAQMIDPNYHFILPRSQRTGHMAARKTHDVVGLRGTISHQVDYAQRVYELHKRRGNDFLRRFISNTQPKIQAAFSASLDKAVDDISKRV